MNKNMNRTMNNNINMEFEGYKNRDNGIFHQGDWMEYTGMKCPHCGGAVYGQTEHYYVSEAHEYEPIPNYYCPHCKSQVNDLGDKIEFQLSFVIGYDVPINDDEGLYEFMKDENGELIVFHDKAEAEKYIVDSNMSFAQKVLAEFIDVHVNDDGKVDLLGDVIIKRDVPLLSDYELREIYIMHDMSDE